MPLFCPIVVFRAEALNRRSERVQSLCARPIVFERLWLLGEKRREPSWVREAFSTPQTQLFGRKGSARRL